jgi:hydrogenase/urease accessory protein HupE
LPHLPHARPDVSRLARHLVLPLTLATAWAAAHPLSVSYSELSVHDDSLAAVYRLPLDDMDLMFALDSDLDGEVGDDELKAARDAIEGYVADRVAIRAGATPLAPSLHSLSRWRDQDDWPYLEARVEYPLPADAPKLSVTVELLTDLYPDHRNLMEIELDGERRQFVFQHANTWTGERHRSGARQTVVEFLRLGVEHIVTGYDHQLFLLGLLLVGRGLRDLVAIVTAFTVAHSVTLAAAVTGLANPPGWMIEPAIALSIVYVGAENLLSRQPRRRWLLAFAFGLVHGFGFASVLQEMELSSRGLLLTLLPFNLGVEIGQLAIVACVWPLLSRLRDHRWRLPVMRTASVLIAFAGAFWFVQRVT